MAESIPQPFETKRIVKAFLLAPVMVMPLPIFLLFVSFVLDSASLKNFLIILLYYPVAILVCYAHILVLALPAFLLLRKYSKTITKNRCLLAGLITGALPYLIVMGIIESIAPHGHGNIPEIIGIDIAFASSAPPAATSSGASASNLAQ